ncbi:hypothetical protein [Jannaschia pohangensis]|uniref:hypothetical protein n=1 Tax=Jannaschia pohangensis TaxID=390807 RepID=UPI000B816D7A|nr:hypothetical protein [Jannaschia pohangensis]
MGDGSHLLAVARETGTLVLRDLATGQDIATDAVFELNPLFLDLDGSRVIIVRRTAGHRPAEWAAHQRRRVRARFHRHDPSGSLSTRRQTTR